MELSPHHNTLQQFLREHFLEFLQISLLLEFPQLPIQQRILLQQLLEFLLQFLLPRLVVRFHGLQHIQVCFQERFHPSLHIILQQVQFILLVVRFRLTLQLGSLQQGPPQQMLPRLLLVLPQQFPQQFQGGFRRVLQYIL